MAELLKHIGSQACAYGRASTLLLPTVPGRVGQDPGLGYNLSSDLSQAQHCANIGDTSEQRNSQLETSCVCCADWRPG